MTVAFGHVDTDFDHGRRHEQIEFASCVGAHHPIFLVGRHCSGERRHAHAAQRVDAPEPFECRGDICHALLPDSGETRIDEQVGAALGLARLDRGADDERLAARCDLFSDALPGPRHEPGALPLAHDMRADGRAPGGHRSQL